MAETLRVDLPSGGWWELAVPQTWGEFRELKEAAQDYEDPHLIDRMLVAVTSAWSFDGLPTFENMAKVDIEDCITVQGEFNKSILPLYSRVLLMQRRNGSQSS